MKSLCLQSSIYFFFLSFFLSFCHYLYLSLSLPIFLLFLYQWFFLRWVTSSKLQSSKSIKRCCELEFEVMRFKIMFSTFYILLYNFDLCHPSLVFFPSYFSLELLLSVARAEKVSQWAKPCKVLQIERIKMFDIFRYY